jgi:hypothetical protein
VPGQPAAPGARREAARRERLAAIRIDLAIDRGSRLPPWCPATARADAVHRRKAPGAREASKVARSRPRLFCRIRERHRRSCTSRMRTRQISRRVPAGAEQLALSPF